ncbi:VaFE repeat-containing surface-anchored protein [Enterococcus faecalis]|uniref:VaFE repeat-containing surface-anchored protein n=1 Tax=Enterococcus faecalis TaxID=1351 RepID=UPI0040421204
MNKRQKQFNKRVWLRLLAVIQLLLVGLMPVIAHADLSFPKAVTIEWDINQLYTFRGANADGTPFYDVSTGLFAVYDNVRQPVFCIEPGVVIYNPVTLGYEANPLPAMNAKAKFTSVLWKYAGTDMDTQVVAQAIMWEEVNGKRITSITKPDGSLMANYGLIKEKINTIVTNYKKQPSFNNQTVKAKLGESVTLTDTNDAGLFRFDTLANVKNPANVDWKISGNTLTITPTKDSNLNGTLGISKSMDKGTPVAYKKAGQQTVVAGAIDDPNAFQIKLVVIKKGDLKIVKRDKESGALVPNTTFTLSFSDKSPNRDVITGADGTVTVKDIALHDTEVTVVEKSVPAPYTIDKTPLKAKIIAGETVEVTSNNLRQKGQIKLEKQGTESGTTLWNSNYTLAGNEFQIRKDSVTGPIVKTLKTDAHGKAETPADSPNALELGTYFVVESKASPGFVKSFEPVKVDLTYAGQTVPLVVKPAVGKNQETTGRTTLIKQDAETGNEPQGRATFTGAEYTLYHDDGTPVKWSEAYHPKLVTGTKVNDEHVTVRLDEKTAAIVVDHLALNHYRWQETKAPVGYQIDKTPYEVALTYQNQDTPVVVAEATSKENVIKFNFSGFKYVTSKNGSAQSGYNGLGFTLTPLEPTKGKRQKVTTVTDAQGYDGAFSFNNIVYGDYELNEVQAPAGFKTIAPLVVHSSYDEGLQAYQFTITEKGQNEPIKTLTVSEDTINKGSNIINLNKLFLFDDSIQIPELESTLTDENEGKILYADGVVKLTDQLSYRHLDSFIGKTVQAEATLTLNGEPVQIDEKAITATTTFTPKRGKGTVNVTYEFDASKLDAATVKQLTSFARLSDDKGRVIVTHEEPDSIEQTMKVKYPALWSTATYDNGEKQAYAGEKVTTVEEVFYQNLHAGPYYLVTKVMDKTANQVLLETESKQRVASAGTADSWRIKQALNTKEVAGHELVYLEYVYQDPEHTQLVIKHDDINDASQTIMVVAKDTPLIATQTHTGNGKSQVLEAQPGTLVYDQLSLTGLTIGDHYHYDLQLHRIEGEKDQVLYNDSFEFQAEKTTLKKEVKTTIDTSEDADGVYYVWTEQLKDDEGNLLADHSNLKDQTEIVTVSIPTITTKARDGDGKTQILEAQKEAQAVDKILFERLVVAETYHYDYQLHRMDGEKDTIVHKASFDFKAEQTTLEKEVTAPIDTSKDTDGVYYVWTGRLKNDKNHVLADHSDLTNKEETLTVSIPVIDTQARDGDGKTQIIEAQKETKVIDKIHFERLVVAGEYDYEYQLHRIEGKKDTTVHKANFAFTAKQTSLEKEVTATIDTSKDIDGVYYVWTGQLKNEKKHVVANHSDVTNKKETLTVSVPTITTQAHNGDGKTQRIEAKKETKVADKILLERLVVGSSYRYEYQLHRIEGKEDTVVHKNNFDFKAGKNVLEKEVTAIIDTTKDTNGVYYVWTGQLKNEKGHVIADHSDLTNKKETLTIAVPIPSILPQTGEYLSRPWVRMAGGVLLVGVLYCWKRDWLLRHYRRWRLRK